MPKSYWTNRLAGVNDTAAILDLVRAVHGDRHLELNEAYWRWRYLNTGGFRAEIIMAEHEGRPIGIQPVAIFDWQWGQRRFPGAMYTGVLTHPDHRRRGVFSSLIGSSNEHSARLGAMFSMTMPNDASLPGFTKLGDWRYPGPIPMALKVVHGGNLIRRMATRARSEARPTAKIRSWQPCRSAGPAGMHCEAVTAVPAEITEVFDCFARECGALMLRRTAEYWNWRYTTKPGSAYHTLLLRSGGAVHGAVVTSVGKRMGLDIGMIVDVVAAGGTPVLRRLIWEAEADLRNRGLGLVACQATSPALARALSAQGYIRPPPTLLPKRFHFVYRLTGVPGLPRPPDRLSDWHLTFGDSDNA